MMSEELKKLTSDGWSYPVIGNGGDSDGDGKVDPYKHLVTSRDGSKVWDERTHYDGRCVVTWDGDTAGLVANSRSNMFKVSDLMPTKEEIQQGFEWTAAGAGASSVTFNKVDYFDWGFSLTFKNMSICVVKIAPVRVSTATYPETGLYFGKSRAYCSSLSWGSLKQLDEKFIPDTIARTADANIITSPNGTRYQLTVSDDGILTATAITE